MKAPLRVHVLVGIERLRSRYRPELIALDLRILGRRLAIAYLAVLAAYLRLRVNVSQNRLERSYERLEKLVDPYEARLRRFENSPEQEARREAWRRRFDEDEDGPRLP